MSISNNIPQTPSLHNPHLFKKANTGCHIDSDVPGEEKETIPETTSRNLQTIGLIANSVQDIAGYSISETNNLLSNILEKHPNLTEANKNQELTSTNPFETFLQLKKNITGRLKYLIEKERLNDTEKGVVKDLIEHLEIFSNIHILHEGNQGDALERSFREIIFISFPEYFKQASEWLIDQGVFSRTYISNPECECPISSNEKTNKILEELGKIMGSELPEFNEEQEAQTKEKDQSSKGLVPQRLAGVLPTAVHDSAEMGKPQYMGDIINIAAARGSLFMTHYSFNIDEKGNLNFNPIGLKDVSLPDTTNSRDITSNEIFVKVPVFKTDSKDGVIKIPTPLHFAASALSFEDANGEKIKHEELEIKQDLFGITYILNPDLIPDNAKYISYKLSPFEINLSENILERCKEHYKIKTQREETKDINELLEMAKGDTSTLFNLFRKKAAISQQLYTLNKFVHLTLKHAPNLLETIESLGIIGECQKLATYWCNEARTYDIPAFLIGGLSTDHYHRNTGVFRSDVGHAQLAYHDGYSLRHCETTEWSSEAYEINEDKTKTDFQHNIVNLISDEKKLCQFLLSIRASWRLNKKEEREAFGSSKKKDLTVKLYEKTTELINLTNLWNSNFRNESLKTNLLVLNKILTLSSDTNTIFKDSLNKGIVELPIARLLKQIDKDKYISSFLETFYANSNQNELFKTIFSLEKENIHLLREGPLAEIIGNIIEPAHINSLNQEELQVLQKEVLCSELSDSTKAKLLNPLGKKAKEMDCLVYDRKIFDKAIKNLTDGGIYYPETIKNCFEYCKSFGSKKAEIVFIKTTLNVLASKGENLNRWLEACYESKSLTEYVRKDSSGKFHLSKDILSKITNAYREHFFFEGIDEEERKESWYKPDREPTYDHHSVIKTYTGFQFEEKNDTLSLLRSLGIDLKDSINKEQAIEILRIYYFGQDGNTKLVHNFDGSLDNTKLLSLTLDQDYEKDKKDIEKIREQSSNVIKFCNHFGITEDDLVANIKDFKKEPKWITDKRSYSKLTRTERMLVMATSNNKLWSMGALIARSGLEIPHISEVAALSSDVLAETEKIKENHGYCLNDYGGVFEQFTELLLKTNFPPATLGRFSLIVNMLNTFSKDDSIKKLQESLRHTSNESKSGLVDIFSKHFEDSPLSEEIKNELNELSDKELITLVTIISASGLSFAPSTSSYYYSRGEQLPDKMFNAGNPWQEIEELFRSSSLDPQKGGLLDSCHDSDKSYFYGIFRSAMNSGLHGGKYLSEAGNCYPLIQEFSKSLDNKFSPNVSSLFRNGRTSFAGRLDETKMFARANDGDLYQLDEKKGDLDFRRKSEKASARTDKHIVIDAVDPISINPNHFIVDIERLMPSKNENFSEKVKELTQILISEVSKRKTLHLHLFYRGSHVISYDTKSGSLQKVLNNKEVQDHLGKMTVRERFIAELNYLGHLAQVIKNEELKAGFNYIPGPICNKDWTPTTKSGTITLFPQSTSNYASLQKSRLQLQNWHRKKHFDIQVSYDTKA